MAGAKKDDDDDRPAPDLAERARAEHERREKGRHQRIIDAYARKRKPPEPKQRDLFEGRE